MVTIAVVLFFYAVPVTVIGLAWLVISLQNRVAVLEKTQANIEEMVSILDERLAEVEAKTATMV